MPATVVLEVTAGPIAGRLFTFDSHDTLVFGRSRDCHALLEDDPRVSRHHFIVEINPPDIRLRDLGSLNGTFVNQTKHGGRSAGETPADAGQRSFPTVDLRHGDEVRAGRTTIRVTVDVPAERLATLVERLICDRCGRDVSAEQNPGRRGEYVCAKCRDEVLADSAGIRRLLGAVRRADKAGPQEIAGYELGPEIGRGGMGVVYRAKQLATGRTVAIKTLLARVAVNEPNRRMFQREIEVAVQLAHPHIVSPIESGSAGSVFYFVMEFCEAGSIDALQAKHGGRLPLVVAAPLVLQATQGLEHAHARGVVHRDLKPSNILLQKTEHGPVAKITDFGLAKNFELAGLSGMTATGSWGGTLPFTPREQLTNFKYVAPESDVWSMAATIYYLLTSAFPLDFPSGRDPVEVLLGDDPVPIRARDPRIPARLATVIDRALSTDPAKRYANAGELSAALENAL